MRISQIGMVLPLLAALLILAADRAQADVQFHCQQESASVPLGEFLYEFFNPILAVGEPDSVDIIIEPFLPAGWFTQVCQTSTGVCYFDNVRIPIGVFPADELRVDIFPDAGTEGMGWVKLTIKSVNDPGQDYHCTYTLFNGLPVEESDISIDCENNTEYTDGATIVEFFSPITNSAAFDDSVRITPTFEFPAGWFGQFCQTSTGVCYFDAATIPLAAGFTDTLRVDFFPNSSGIGIFDLELESTANPSNWNRCFYRVYDGDQAADTPEILSGPATTASFAQPNPFSDGTTLRMSLQSDSVGDLAIYNATGREVQRFSGLSLSAGDNSIEWDGRDHDGVSVPSGVYFYQLQTMSEEAKGIMIRSR